jgi:hypothetical protein
MMIAVPNETLPWREGGSSSGMAVNGQNSSDIKKDNIPAKLPNVRIFFGH